MITQRIFATALAIQLLASVGAADGADEIGEVKIRSVLPLSSAERAHLAMVTKENREAALLLAARVEEANRVLALEPSPIGEIIYEGRVNTDPERMETVKHLRDMDRAAVLLEENLKSCSVIARSNRRGEFHHRLPCGSVLRAGLPARRWARGPWDGRRRV